MLQELFFVTPWIAIALWVTLYVADYYLTIWGARLYVLHANQYFVFSGSYELNPVFQKDVDGLRHFSPRFLALLVGTSVFIALSWFLSLGSPDTYGFFDLVYGMLVLLELPVILRHLRNIQLFYSIRQPGQIRGQVVYSRPLMLRQSSVELFGFGLLYLLAALAVGGLFFVGGAVSCALVASRHWSDAKRAPALVEPAEEACA
jgi:hypothetical protein